MKKKPKNWDDLDRRQKTKYILGKETGVCSCNHTLGEFCNKCEKLPNIPIKDRNFHEEVMLLIRAMAEESFKSDEYYLYLSLVELDDIESFNQQIRYYFFESKLPFDEAFPNYHKSIRQCDYYTHLTIVRDKKSPDANGEFERSGGVIDSLLYNFIHMSQIPYVVLKRLCEL